MSNAQEMSQSCWQQLDYEWGCAHDGWNDGTTDYFLAHYWSPLERQVGAYRRALEMLTETMNAALQIVSE